MSWHMTSFLVLGAVLVAGLVWYERSRPPSQVVALVAALAALAIVGRVAFAAFPNVKPTTDIIVFAGYALGGAPGFAVGALAALVSNFWFGQGPWTPWQMVAWGLCGVFGAALALGIRNAGRLTLATACGFAGIAFGTLMNFSQMATYGGDLSWRYFWVLEGRAIPFEVAHVAGNVAFALLAGPAMVRMLTRFRERFEWSRGSASATQSPPHLGALRSGGVAALLLVCALGAFAPAAHASEVSQAVHWLESQQRPSGGFPAAAEREPGSEMTAWVMLALAAADRNPLDVTNSGKSPVDFLRRHLGEVNDPGDVARTILALEASGVDPHDFAGENLVARLLGERRKSGSYQGWPGTSAYAVLALRAAGANDAAAPTVEWLRKVQGNDGGWGNEPKEPSTAEVTGAVLQVLSPGSDATDAALAYMRKAKRDNGGFAPANNLSANAQATAWASQGLLAAGKDPASFGTGKSSFAYMRELQVSAGYFLQAPNQEASPVWVTADVLIPLSGHFLPIAAPARAPQPKAKKNSNTAPASSGTELHGEVPKIFDQPGSSSAPAPGEVPKALGGEGGAASGGSAHSGRGAPGIESGQPAGGGSLPQGEATIPSESSAPSEASGEPAAETTDSGSGTAGSIVLGLLAGCVLFLLGFGARRGWMRWRYGL